VVEAHGRRCQACDMLALGVTAILSLGGVCAWWGKMIHAAAPVPPRSRPEQDAPNRAA